MMSTSGIHIKKSQAIHTTPDIRRRICIALCGAIWVLSSDSVSCNISCTHTWRSQVSVSSTTRTTQVCSFSSNRSLHDRINVMLWTQAGPRRDLFAWFLWERCCSRTKLGLLCIFTCGEDLPHVIYLLYCNSGLQIYSLEFRSAISVLFENILKQSIEDLILFVKTVTK